jgi:long-chain fatty acid transport protein
VALQNLPVVFALDRAGLVGADGPTHAGAYDIPYLRCVPNVSIACPADENECRKLLTAAFEQDHPVAVRYPRGAGVGVAPGLTLGATWASKVRGQFDKYSGLFANGGRFDVPENYGLGAAFRPNADWTFGADLQTIRYSKVAAVGNSIAGLLQGTPLGANGGPGFGWRDVKVWKLAVSHALTPALLLRAGISHATQPVPAGETFFNILSPGVVQDHLTIGATWSGVAGGELSGFFAYARGKAVNGSNSIPASFAGGNADVRLRETIVGASYAWKL